MRIRSPHTIPDWPKTQIVLGVGAVFAEIRINGFVRIIRTVQIPPVD